MQYCVGKIDQARFGVPAVYAGHASGFERSSLIDRAAGSVHVEACIARLQSGGHVAGCVHAYEKGLYVFEGELELLRNGELIVLPADSYALVPTATAHAFRNRGTQTARWFEVLAPQPKPAAALRDTFFTGDDAWPEPSVPAGAPAAVGCFKAENPIAGRSGELQRGMSVFRFMERSFGARCFLMMRGEMAVGGHRTRHDHPLEEFYLGLSGEVEMEIEDRSFRLGAGDFAWTGVGTSHAFRHVGGEPFRWLETQTPQFPPDFGTRNYVEWEKLRAGR